MRSYWVEIDSWPEGEARLRWLRGEPDHFAPQTPVVIVSDFELGREMTPRWPQLAPWLPLIRRINSAAAKLLALVPVSHAVWPAALLEAIPNAVPWDVTTSTGAVRRSIS